MSLKFWLKETVTIERNTPVQDESGGWTPSYAAISVAATNIKATIFPKRHGKQNLAQDFGNRGEFFGEFNAVINVDVGVIPGDRIKIGSIYYEIESVNDFSHDQISADTVIVMTCNKRQVS